MFLPHCGLNVLQKNDHVIKNVHWHSVNTINNSLKYKDDIKVTYAWCISVLAQSHHINVTIIVAIMLFLSGIINDLYGTNGLLINVEAHNDLQGSPAQNIITIKCKILIFNNVFHIFDISINLMFITK